MTQPSSGGPRYTMDTSVFPYTADTEGYKRLSGRPVNSILKKITQQCLFLISIELTSKCNPKEFIISFKCQRIVITV